MSVGTLYLPRGLPASGKTTWARDLVDKSPLGTVVRLNRDDLRAMMLPAGYWASDYDAEELVSLVQRGPIPDLLRAGADVIVDDTNLRLRVVRALVRAAMTAGARWECVDEFLAVPLEECVRRDQARACPVGESVIRRMHDQFLSGGRSLPLPPEDEAVTGLPYIPSPGAIPAIMVDIDGTVATMDGRGPYDASRYHEDLPNTSVIETVCMASAAGKTIVFCSGRSAEFRDVTEQWLREHVIIGGMVWELHMRPAGDTRNDAIIKLELFDEHIRDRFNIAFCLDDRDRVVAAYRSIGLTVYQVAEGNF